MKTETFQLNCEEEYIRLCDLLKICGAVETGGQAKIVILNGEVSVNGEVCIQKGKKLHRGDQAVFGQTVFEVC